jgi:ABC-2 type transport system ATP-binding protein
MSIEVHDLRRSFGDIEAVRGIDLDVRPGEIYGFLGPNGAGKSTTVLILTTLLPATGGRALVGGFDVARSPARVREVAGAALQDVALDPTLTARGHMQLLGALHALPRAERRSRGDELLKLVGLSDVADAKVGGDSGGMKRRLDLALALVHRPSVLFLDEPTTGLDVQSRTALWANVRRLAEQEGVTVFLTTQYLEEADVLADRVAIVDHGAIVVEGSPSELKAQLSLPTVEVVPRVRADEAAIAGVLRQLGEPAEASPGALAVRLTRDDHGATEVVRALDAVGLAVAHLSVRGATLDDVFLAKTGAAPA